jgi:hypothetical protein
MIEDDEITWGEIGDFLWSVYYTVDGWVWQLEDLDCNFTFSPYMDSELAAVVGLQQKLQELGVHPCNGGGILVK